MPTTEERRDQKVKDRMGVGYHRCCGGEVEYHAGIPFCKQCQENLPKEALIFPFGKESQ